MSFARHYLLIKQEGEEITFPLINSSSWTLGRGDNNNVVLKSSRASRNHAVIQSTEPGSFYLIDLGSTNGSYLNGKRVSIPVALQNGDQISVGSTIIQLVSTDQNKQQHPLPDRFIEQTEMDQTHRLISILVIDIRSYTKLSQELPEQALSQVIGTWYSKAWEILQKYGSGVDKYIGDAIMAVWIHKSTEQDKSNLSKEILQLLQALYELYCMSDDLNHNPQFSLPFRLRIGAGVNTGFAIVGQMDAGSRAEYTAIGDTVNAAFRLESATKDMRQDVALGEETFKYISQSELLSFKFHDVPAKGYDQPLRAYGGTFADLGNYISKVVVTK